MRNWLEHKEVIIIGLILLLTPLLFSLRLDNPALPKYFLLEVGVGVALLAAALSAYEFRCMPALKLALLSCLWTGLSISWAVNKGLGVNFFYLKFSLLILMFLLINLKDEALPFFRVILFASLFVGLYGVLQSVGADPFGWAENNIPISSLGNANFAAQYIALVLPLLVALLILERSKTLPAFVILLLLYHLALTRSKGGWLAAFVAILFMVVYLIRLKIIPPRKAAIFALAGVVLVLLVLIFSGQFAGVKKELLVLINPALLDKVRFFAWRDTLAMISSRPLWGYGAGNFAINFPLFAKGEMARLFVHRFARLAHAHNEYLQIIAEEGIIGFFLFVIFLIALFKEGFLAFREADEQERIITLSLLASIIAGLVHSLVSFPLRNPASALVFYASAGLLLAHSPHHRKMPVKRPYVLALAIVLISTSGLLNAFQIISSKALRYGEALLSIGRAGEAMPSIKRASALAPYLAKPYFYLGVAESKEGNWQEAEDAYRRALECEPYSFIHHTNLGEVLMQLGRIDDAEKHLKYAVSLNPYAPRAYQSLSLLYMREKRYEEAEELLKDALRKIPYNPELTVALASVYKVEGKIGEGRKILEALIDYLRENGQKGKAGKLMPLLDAFNSPSP